MSRNETWRDSQHPAFASSVARDLAAWDELPARVRLAIAGAPDSLACEPVLDVWRRLLNRRPSSEEIVAWIEDFVATVAEAPGAEPWIA